MAEKHATIQLTELKLTNYWGIKGSTIQFHPDLTVLIGVNGSGKTATLDALRKAFRIYEQTFRGFPNVTSKDVFEDSDINNTARKKGEMGKVRVKVDLDLGDSDMSDEDSNTSHRAANGKPRRQENSERPKRKKELTWTCNLESNNFIIEEGETDFDQLEKLTVRMNRILRANEDESSQADRQKIIEEREKYSAAPVVVYFSCDRITSDSFRAPLNNQKAEETHPIFQAWEGALMGDSFKFEDFFHWFRQQYGKAQQNSQSQKEKRLFKAVQDAIFGMFGEGDYLKEMSFSWETITGEITVVNPSGEVITLSQLSSGEQNLLILAASLARRLVLANPSLNDPIKEGSAIVMIDEVGLHLHPNWQREVVPRLQNTFKGVQFIVTTHSPFVVNHVQAESVVMLKEGGEAIPLKVVFPNWNTYGAPVDEILTFIFGMERMIPKTISESLGKYFQLIDEGNIDEANNMRKELEKQIDPNHPELVKGEAIMKVKSLKLKP